MLKSGKSYSYWLARFNRKMSFHFPLIVDIDVDIEEDQLKFQYFVSNQSENTQLL